MPRFALAATLIGSVLALSSGAAAAQATVAQASLSDYGYQLVDLDLTDGITPEVTFNTTFRGVLTGAVAHYEDTMYFEGAGSPDGEPASSSSSAGSAAVEAWYSAGEIGARGSIGGAGQYLAGAGWYADYTLSANTKLVFTGHAAASVQPGAFVTDQSSAVSVSVLFAPIGEDGSSSQPYYARAATHPGIPETANFDEWFTLEVVNADSKALSSQMYIAINATGDVSPVPEPATWLMLGAGLALTAGLARRRRAAMAN